MVRFFLISTDGKIDLGRWKQCIITTDYLIVIMEENLEIADPQLCQAMTTNGKPCKKKSKKPACFCNTHLLMPVKETPTVTKRNNQTREVEIREIRGIPYYIDVNHNVYKHEEIQQDNPSIVGRFNPVTGSIEFFTSSSNPL